MLLPIATIYLFGFDEIFSRITVRGYPLIAHKGDLSSTFLGCASFFFFLQPASGIRRVLSKGLSLICFAAMIAWTARAAVVGFGCGVALLLIARRPQFLFYQAGITILLLIVAGFLQFANLKQDNSYLVRILDRLEATTDVSRTYSYRGEVGESSAQNNQFRFVWWESVIAETMDKGPAFGLGFGYDLAKRFLINYGSQLNAFEFDTRSPHSVWVTVFGRMGFLGLASFTLIGALIIRDAVRVARGIARRRAEPMTLAYWCAVITVLGSASFGVVLEGPMGGILFWTLLGLAASQTAEAPEPRKAVSEPNPVIRREPILAR